MGKKKKVVIVWKFCSGIVVERATGISGGIVGASGYKIITVIPLLSDLIIFVKHVVYAYCKRIVRNTKKKEHFISDRQSSYKLTRKKYRRYTCCFHEIIIRISPCYSAMIAPCLLHGTSCTKNDFDILTFGGGKTSSSIRNRTMYPLMNDGRITKNKCTWLPV